MSALLPYYISPTLPPFRPARLLVVAIDEPEQERAALSGRAAVAWRDSGGRGLTRVRRPCGRGAAHVRRACRRGRVRLQAVHALLVWVRSL